MKIIVTHTSPDWDAIGSVWLLKKLLPGWEGAEVSFVPAGQRYKNQEVRVKNHDEDPIEVIDGNEVIHVDTGMASLDHHQTQDRTISATGLTWQFLKKQMEHGKWRMEDTDRWHVKKEAIDRLVKIIVDTDHFLEVFWENPAADYHGFSVLAALDGLKMMKPDQDEYYVKWGIEILECLTHEFENKIWAEREINEHSTEFDTWWGKAVGFETLNDTVLKLAQKMGYMLVVRKDPRKGYVRIKARPDELAKSEGQKAKGVDLTLAYEKLKKIDPDATWFLHVSKKMLLNGTPKNPKMVPTKLTLHEIIEVLKTI